LSGIAKYSGVAVFLHWVVAILIICNVSLSLSFDLFPDEMKRFAYDTHKSIGMTVLGLLIMRVLWRLTHKPPAYPAHYKPWEKRVSHAVHMILYFVMIALPVTGWLHDSAWKAAPEIPMNWFGLFEIPRISMIMGQDDATKESLHKLFGEWHEWSGYALYALVFLHVSGALKHQFIDKQPELQRMWK
jgi:cytochrome b561